MTDAGNPGDWEDRLAAHWGELDHQPEAAWLAGIDALLAERPAGDAIACFERGCAQDSTGHPAEAVPLYRAALAAGLTGLRRRRATIQLASSLRNLGQPQAAVDLLQAERSAPPDELDDAVLAFLGLALAELGREREALALSLGALSRHLPRYNRSLARYARALRPRAAETATGYDALAPAYALHLADELDHKPFDRDWLVALAARLPAGQPVLDIGCGPGHVGRFLRAQGLDVLGLDLSPRMIDEARRLQPDAAFSVGDARALPFAEGALGAIVAMYSIIHLDADELVDVLAEWHRALQPGGVLALAFHVGRQTVRVTELWGVPAALDFSYFETGFVTAALAQAGFRVLSTTERDPYPPPVEAQTQRAYLVAHRPEPTPPLSASAPTGCPPTPPS